MGAVQSDENTRSQQSHSSLRLGKPVTRVEILMAKGTSQTNLQISQNKKRKTP